MKTDLVFPTRDAGVSSPEMTNNLDDALREMELPVPAKNSISRRLGVTGVADVRAFG